MVLVVELELSSSDDVEEDEAEGEKQKIITATRGASHRYRLPCRLTASLTAAGVAAGGCAHTCSACSTSSHFVFDPSCLICVCIGFVLNQPSSHKLCYRGSSSSSSPALTYLLTAPSRRRVGSAPASDSLLQVSSCCPLVRRSLTSCRATTTTTQTWVWVAMSPGGLASGPHQTRMTMSAA